MARKNPNDVAVAAATLRALIPRLSAPAQLIRSSWERHGRPTSWDASSPAASLAAEAWEDWEEEVPYLVAQAKKWLKNPYQEPHLGPVLVEDLTYWVNKYVTASVTVPMRNNPAPEVKALRAQFRKDYDDDWWKSPEIKAEYKRQLAAIGKSPYDSSGPKKPRAPRKPKKPKAPAIPAALTSGALTSQLRQVIPMLNRHIQGTCDRYGGMGMKDRYGSYCKVPPTISHFDVKRKYIYMIGSTGQQEFRIDPKSGEVWRLSASGSPWFVGTLSDILKRGKTIDEHWAENNPKWRW